MNKNNRQKNMPVRPYAGRVARSIRQAIDRIFEENPEEAETGFLKEFDFPKIDVSETEREVKIIADAPGMEPENLKVDVKEDFVLISGSIQRKEEEKGEKFYFLEREYGEFERRIPLPAKVKPEGADALMKNGVLTVTIPKLNKEKSSFLKIKTE